MLTSERTSEGAVRRAALDVARVVDGEAARAASWVFLATRLAFVVIGVAAPILFSDHATRTPPIPTGSGWLRWDAQWFAGIAAHGYTWTLSPSYSPTAFFPLFPLLIHLVSLTGLDTGAAATLIANAAFLGALYYLYRLVRLDWPAPVATRTLWLLSLFPTALFFFVPYTESLYLFLAVLTFWYLRQRRWLAAGVAGGLGAVTRQTGFVIALPFLLEWLDAYGRTALQRQAQRGRSIAALVPIVLIPGAVLAHLLYLWRVTGNATAFMRAQGAWHRRPGPPWAGIVATIQRWVTSPGASHPITTPLQHVHMALELGAVVLFLALLAVGARRLRPSYTVYAAAIWLAALVSPAIADGFQNPLMSSSRFALSVFPSFIVLALLLRKPGAYQAWLSASAMALGFLVAFYVVGGWVA